MQPEKSSLKNDPENPNEKAVRESEAEPENVKTNFIEAASRATNTTREKEQQATARRRGTAEKL